jgi:CRP-like cAMP-binding protein
MSDSLCFGEMELITGEPPSATVRAERDTVLWSPLAPRFATQNDQLRPSLLECARDSGSLRRHWAPTVTSASRHYAALTTLFPISARQRLISCSRRVSR